ncbi:MAG: hypothetical protein IJL93_01660 [Bacteroidales bacterium]|nr:hypothetical protein [Bacteroidales bacterium]
MNRTFTQLLLLAGAVLLLVLWCASGWMAAKPVPDRAFLSGALAIAVILVNAVLLHLANDRILAGSGLLTPAVYIVLAVANPGSLWFSSFHTASLLMAASLVFFLSFCAIRPGMGALLGAWLTLGTAGLLLPQLYWLVPLYVLLAVSKADDKLKFMAASLLAICLPAGVALAFASMGGGHTTSAFFTGIWEQMSRLPHRPLHYSAAKLCRLALTALAALLAAVRALSRIGHYKIARSAAVFRIILLTLSFGALTVLFFPDGQAAPLMALPLALLLNEYFGTTDPGKGATTLAIILLLVLAAERVTYFV